MYHIIIFIYFMRVNYWWIEIGVVPVTLYGFLGNALSSSRGDCFRAASTAVAKVVAKTHNTAAVHMRVAITAICAKTKLKAANKRAARCLAGTPCT